MQKTRNDWVAQRHFCRGPEPFMQLWSGAAKNVGTANRLLADGAERPFSVEPNPSDGEHSPPRDAFTVRRARPDGSVDEVVFRRYLGIIQAAGFGHRIPLTAVFAVDYDDGRVKAVVSYDVNGEEVTCRAGGPSQVLPRALGPLFFARSAAE